MKYNKISPQESEFTEVLAHIALVPKLLYFRGKLPEKRVPSVAIVGARRPTPYGRDVAYQLAHGLAAKGVLVVSGLALGIDAVAHRGALDAGGQTVAVLGSGIDKITPYSNTRLDEIENGGGAIISEYRPGTPSIGYHYLERNRLVSGLADAVVVVEAAVRSGTLNTAGHALAQGRYVFAVPGNINSPMSVGCNNLIKQGAQPLTKVSDVLAVIAPELMRTEKPSEVLGDTPAETAILQLVQKGVYDGEDIMRRLGVPASEFNQTVTMLEIKGLLRALGANKWALG